MNREKDVGLDCSTNSIGLNNKILEPDSGVNAE